MNDTKNITINSLDVIIPTYNGGVRLIECVKKIEEQEFSHSHARNLGVESSDSDAILFMTQDAIPISNDWLLRMIEPMQEGFAAVSCTDNTDKSTDLYYKVGTWRYQKDLKILHTDKVCEYQKGMTKKEIRENSISTSRLESFFLTLMNSERATPRQRCLIWRFQASGNSLIRMCSITLLRGV